jgi:hypothetical protein
MKLKILYAESSARSDALDVYAKIGKENRKECQTALSLSHRRTFAV